MSALSWVAILQLAANPACSVPGMTADFWPRVVHQESARDPFALHDDDTNTAYYPKTAEAAEAIAVRLMGLGHSVGVGLSQLTSRNQQHFHDKFGITIRDALDACTNMHIGARHYVIGALSIYNSGSPTSTAGTAYARRILASADDNTIRKAEAASAPADTDPGASQDSAIDDEPEGVADPQKESPNERR